MEEMVQNMFITGFSHETLLAQNNLVLRKITFHMRWLADIPFVCLLSASSLSFSRTVIHKLTHVK